MTENVDEQFPTPIQDVNVEGEGRSGQRYEPDQVPYDIKGDTLEQKLWVVCHAEFGPGVADVLSGKLHQAVIDHVTGSV